MVSLLTVVRPDVADPHNGVTSHHKRKGCDTVTLDLAFAREGPNATATP